MDNITVSEGVKRLPGGSTVFQAELMAIKFAMTDMAANINEGDRYIKLSSDSRAAIQALNSHVITSQLVKDTVHAINRLGGMMQRLEISWIKAHIGHPGNEKADELAKSAANRVKYQNYVDSAKKKMKLSHIS